MTAAAGKSAFYVPALRGVPERLLSLLDRDPGSRSAGSFDREHWAWKFRDFPLGMMQTAVYPLALLWRHPFPENPCHGSARVLEWIFTSATATLARQHRNGAFDGFAPNEREPGVTLGVLHGLAEAWRIVGGQAPAALTARFHAALRRGCELALGQRELETHAFISNHHALFAVALHSAGEMLGEPRYQQAAKDVAARIINRQSPDGWYPEYDGPDPGYESLGVHHLATYWARTRDPQLLASLRRCLEFFAYCVHPDGSVGGAYGSRHTALYFPGGFEILSAEIPQAAAVAGFLRERLHHRNVAQPLTADAENLVPLCYSYLEAVLAPAGDAREKLPCESSSGARYFAASGIHAIASPRYYAIVNARQGGVCRIFDRQAEKVAYEDAGYLLRIGTTDYVTQRGGAPGPPLPASKDEVVAAASAAPWQQILPTPFAFVVLRLLNLTLCRLPGFGNWLRNRVIAKLMGSKRDGPLQLLRRMQFEPDAIHFHDRLEAARALPVQSVALPRSLTAFHMGSAKYFLRSETEPLPAAPVTEMAASLRVRGIAQCKFSLVWTRSDAPRLVVDGDTASPAPVEVQSTR
jgi:hypothetical protein